MIDTIVCLLKNSVEYDIDYVGALVESLKKHIKRDDIEYVCVSDNFQVQRICTHIPLENMGYDGFWNKIQLFNIPYLFDRKVLYFDLDTVIRGDITDLTLYDPINFTMLKGFMTGNPASGMMAWSGNQSAIAKAYNPEVNHLYSKINKFGDQGFIADQLQSKPLFFQDLFPNRICSYKLEKEKRGKSDIVCFHGKPRPRSVNWTV